MLDHRNSVVLIFFGCSFAYLSEVRAKFMPCSQSFAYPQDYTFNQPCCDPAPAEVTQNAGESYIDYDGDYEEIPTINVTLTKIRDNFNMTLLAIPMDKDDCPPIINENSDLRRYYKTCVVFQREEGEKHETIIDYIFTGCYYVLMTNATGVSWQSKPKFYNTSYLYRNTKIEHSEPQITPDTGSESMTVKIMLGIPMECIRVQAMIYELDNKLADMDNQTIKNEILDSSIPSSQECGFKPDGLLSSYPCKNSNTTTKLTFNMENRGEIVVTWANLSRSGGVYYLWFHGYTSECYGKYNIDYPHVTRWKPIIEDIFISIGHKNLTNEVTDKSNPNTFYLVVALCAVLGVSIIAVLAYFTLKCYRNKKFLVEKRDLKEFLEREPIIANYLKQILLVYAKGEPEFMTKMNSLRYQLTKQCDCEVHDVYSPKEFGTVAKLGASGWVRKLLIDGSKVVWVDTPQLRSRFDFNQRKDDWSDFRDAAIPYAVELATNLFQNPATQYLDHFVVQVEGFEVEDGCDADPLRVISPHRRYYIPVHFARLCGDLTKASESPEDNMRSPV